MQAEFGIHHWLKSSCHLLSLPKRRHGPWAEWWWRGRRRAPDRAKPVGPLPLGVDGVGNGDPGRLLGPVGGDEAVDQVFQVAVDLRAHQKLKTLATPSAWRRLGTTVSWLSRRWHGAVELWRSATRAGSGASVGCGCRRLWRTADLIDGGYVGGGGQARTWQLLLLSSRHGH